MEFCHKRQEIVSSTSLTVDGFLADDVTSIAVLRERYRSSQQPLVFQLPNRPDLADRAAEALQRVAATQNRETSRANVVCAAVMTCGLSLLGHQKRRAIREGARNKNAQRILSTTGKFSEQSSHGQIPNNDGKCLKTTQQLSENLVNEYVTRSQVIIDLETKMLRISWGRVDAGGFCEDGGVTEIVRGWTWFSYCIPLAKIGQIRSGKFERLSSVSKKTSDKRSQTCINCGSKRVNLTPNYYWRFHSDIKNGPLQVLNQTPFNTNEARKDGFYSYLCQTPKLGDMNEELFYFPVSNNGVDFLADYEQAIKVIEKAVKLVQNEIQVSMSLSNLDTKNFDTLNRSSINIDFVKVPSSHDTEEVPPSVVNLSRSMANLTSVRLQDTHDSKNSEKFCKNDYDCQEKNDLKSKNSFCAENDYDKVFEDVPKIKVI